MNRRTFVKTAGGAAAAAVLPIQPSYARDHIDKIGLQLYTVRNQMKVSVERTLSQVAEIGYKEVEFANDYFGRPPRAIKQLLDDNGLKAPSAHIDIRALRGPWNRTLSDAAEIEHKWLVIASADSSDLATLDAIKRTADLIHKAADDAKFYKIKIGYHNHDAEFAVVAGKPIYDHLLELTKASELDFEMDLYWITKGGGDPLAYWKRWPGRFPLVHVKDAGPAPVFAMQDVGKGTIHWAELFAHRKDAGIKHYFVEYDNPPDPMASIKVSFDYLKQLQF